MSAPEKREAKVISFELQREELFRFRLLELKAKQRNKLSRRSDLLRELIGLTDNELTKVPERAYFQQGGTMPKTLRDVEPAVRQLEASAAQPNISVTRVKGGDKTSEEEIETGK